MKKYQVCGFQFPGEEGITAKSLKKLLDLNSGYYFDIIRIDEENNQSGSYFVIDSELYGDWLYEGLIEEFTDFIRGILGDMIEEEGGNVYPFHGVEVYLGYD